MASMLASKVRPCATQFGRFMLPLRTRNYSSITESTFEHIKVSTPRSGVGLVEINRPKALNALFTPLILELNTAMKAFDKDPTIGAMVLTGSHKAFAAGADIKEMSTKDFADSYGADFIESWSELPNTIKKPVISAVNGHALGGGCELAMMCDILYCSEKANFGQPEIKLGVIPGAGGSQRLTRAIGKSRAMELILTGKNFSGRDAYDWGLAARVFETPEQCVDGALDTAEQIASYSRIAVKACKEVVNKSQDLGIREGVEFERRLFHGLFGSEDQKIGMKAFAEKKKPEWKHR
ncbi:putative enoyl-CoA hydratase [Pseudocercospora fuligena]|uniref:Probable enoyl-CoA hydratase, mitochondrial n=1 Tax=Pseudocercospora fuligena TaxID=685502 RepID=A0A8H6RDA8_9PEZI|nr:putative enoyl-CoA hydratase [Pseudocercospora fuligena]